jgi:hypothetical protein
MSARHAEEQSAHVNLRFSLRVFAGVSEVEPQMTAWDDYR